MSEVRTRIAPSPTGGLHIGHMRTILFDYALAKKNNGKFIIRIEDTDQKRYVEGAVDQLLNVINDYGITWDEGPRVGGKFAPYVQSERLDLYKKYAEQLVAQGDAYYCFLNEDETKKLQEEARLEGRKFRSPYRDSSKSEIDELLNQKKESVIRLKVPQDKILTFEDAIIGKVTFNTSEVDDQILLKTDGFPTYHLAVVVDDHLMEITHILRGNDWLPSTPKHVLLYNAFGWELPVFAHLPNLKEKDSGKKLSKRFGAVFAVQFLEAGYLPEALNNFLMLLGWSSPEARVHGQKERELFTLEEFVGLFSLDRVQKTALVSFDREKLKWFNQQYLKKLDSSTLTSKFTAWLEKYQSENENYSTIQEDLANNTLEAKLNLVKERATTMLDMIDMLKFFYSAPSTIEWKIPQTENYFEKIKLILERITNLFENMDDDSTKWNQELWAEEMRKVAQEFEIKGGDSFMVLRIATVGGPYSPPLFEALQILGKTEVIKRLQTSFN